MAKVLIDSERCKGCELCVNACPKKIVKICDDKLNSHGFRPAEIADEDACVKCGFCAITCPDCAITIEGDEH